MVMASAPELRANQLIYNAIITKFPDKSKLDDFYNVTDADFLEALDHYYVVINERDK
jgi:hypothetical protein